MHINSTVLLIGSGRLAFHLKHWNSQLDNPNPILTWNRSQTPQVLKDYLTKATHIWLAISDSAILPFYDHYLHDAKQKIVHFSGALHDSRLYCAHPLMSFPKSLLRDEIYSKIFFVLDGTAALSEILPGFLNNYKAMSSEDKAYYHALCVLAGNFPQLIWKEVSEKLEALDLPPEAFNLYIKQVTDNFLAIGKLAITGPIIRKDHQTIEKNLSSLDKSKNLKNIYSVMAKEFSS